jgi:hypothetical protein
VTSTSTSGRSRAERSDATAWMKAVGVPASMRSGPLLAATREAYDPCRTAAGRRARATIGR